MAIGHFSVISGNAYQFQVAVIPKAYSMVIKVQPRQCLILQGNLNSGKKKKAFFRLPIFKNYSGSKNAKTGIGVYMQVAF